MFASFLVAMLLFGAAAGVATWWILTQRAAAFGEARRLLFAEAQAVALQGGRAALTDWLREGDAADPRRRLFVYDATGRELLGRSAPAIPWAGERAGPGAGRAERPPRFDPGAGPLVAGPPGAASPLPARGPIVAAPDGSLFRLRIVGPGPMRLGPFALPETRAVQLLLALAIAALVSALLARTVTRPVAALEQAARALAAGRLDARVGPPTTARHDEVGRLGAAFDVMAARLEAAVRGREQLLRDVSHELRSPLARMRVALGLAERGDADLPRQHGRISAEIDRLDTLLGQILDVSRLADGSGALRREPLDLAALLERVVGDGEFEAAAAGKSVRLDAAPGPLPVVADAHWLAAAFENVVRNAIRYTPPGTQVIVAVEPGAQRGSKASGGAEASVTVRVEDRGPGVPQADLGRIFEPFHRAGGRERDAVGAGLGLAIAARVVGAHGGTIEARNRGDAPGGEGDAGLVIRIHLPRGSDTAA
jgi:two-component system sensor histidine kinase CpxA